MGGIHDEIGDLRAEMHEEIGKLSDRMGQLSDRMTRVETLIETHLVPALDARDPAGTSAIGAARRRSRPCASPVGVCCSQPYVH